MADRTALGKLGLIFGAVTAAVMLMAIVVVKAQTGVRADNAAADAAFARFMDAR